jgi:hypothetical protein
MTKVIHYFELPNKNVKKNKLFSEAQKKPTDEAGFQTKQLMKRDANVRLNQYKQKKSNISDALIPNLNYYYDVQM